MSNMSYCRFRNTLSDLEDCYEHFSEVNSREEAAARKRLVKVCEDILEEADFHDVENENLEDYAA